MPACPRGHASEWTDFCSVCGVPMAETASGSALGDPAAAGATGAAGSAVPAGGRTTGGAASPSGAAADTLCPTCGYPREPGGTFCESCGYDFQTGQLPAAPTVAPAAAPDPAGAPPSPPASSASAASSAAAPSAPSAASSPASAAPQASGTSPADAGSTAGAPVYGASAASSGAWWATVEADRSYYDRFSAGGPVDYPDQPPPPQSIPLLSATVSVGRRSRSRGTSPEIDLSGPPEDPAVSHKHASLVRQPDGSFSLVDNGSTNGTRLNDEEDPIEVNVARPLKSGDRIYVGAWSRVTIEQR